jgi:uncharacterized protein (TIGR00255 family)
MIRSMTGFASLSRDDDVAAVGVTVRSVNHRYLDVQVRVPQNIQALEGRLRSVIQRHVARGRIEVTVSLQVRQTAVPEVALNEALARRLAETIERARDLGLVSGPLQPGDLLRLPQALTIREREVDVTDPGIAGLSDAVEALVGAAMTELDSMRVAEGRHTKADLDQRWESLSSLVDRVEAAAAEGRSGLLERLGSRVLELTGGLECDQAAIAQEIVRVAARSDISEETARFRAHLSQWRSLVEGGEPCGRKLDFLLQEMNREVNTIGSKADGASVPALIIEAKAELEKMREQVQNVE